MIQNQDQTFPTPLSLNLQNLSLLKLAQVQVLTDSAAAAAGSGTGFGIGSVGLDGEQGGFSCLWFWGLVWIQLLEQHRDRSLGGTRCPGPTGVQALFGLEGQDQVPAGPAGSLWWFGPVMQELRVGSDVEPQPQTVTWVLGGVSEQKVWVELNQQQVAGTKQTQSEGLNLSGFVDLVDQF